MFTTVAVLWLCLPMSQAKLSHAEHLNRGLNPWIGGSLWEHLCVIRLSWLEKIHNICRLIKLEFRMPPVNWVAVWDWISHIEYVSFVNETASVKYKDEQYCDDSTRLLKWRGHVLSITIICITTSYCEFSCFLEETCDGISLFLCFFTTRWILEWTGIARYCSVLWNKDVKTLTDHIKSSTSSKEKEPYYVKGGRGSEAHDSL